MSAYYNEIDRYCCDWLSNLMDAGHITPGKIDDRSILDVSPDDVRGYGRVHWFAGIAGWDLALNLAGWRGSVWTGSCPCQPLSSAGQRKGHADERHIWPAFYRLIAECRPAVVFGEQVASKDGREWLAAVRADLEESGYAVGAANLPACSVGAPHIRQRLWWVADTGYGTARAGEELQSKSWAAFARNGSATGLLADAQRGGRDDTRHDEREHDAEGRSQWPIANNEREPDEGRNAIAGFLADMPIAGRSQQPQRDAGTDGRAAAEPGRLRDAGNPWSDLVWLPCTDGRARPTQPGLFPLAHAGEFRNRVAILRAAGNAIVPALAAEFIRASCEHTANGGQTRPPKTGAQPIGIVRSKSTVPEALL